MSEAVKPRRPGRPKLAESGRSSTYVSAPAAEIEAWRRAAKAAEQTLNGWIRATLNARIKG